MLPATRDAPAISRETSNTSSLIASCSRAGQRPTQHLAGGSVPASFSRGRSAAVPTRAQIRCLAERPRWGPVYGDHLRYGIDGGRGEKTDTADADGSGGGHRHPVATFGDGAQQHLGVGRRPSVGGTFQARQFPALDLYAAQFFDDPVHSARALHGNQRTADPAHPAVQACSSLQVQSSQSPRASSRSNRPRRRQSAHCFMVLVPFSPLQHTHDMRAPPPCGDRLRKAKTTPETGVKHAQ